MKNKHTFYRCWVDVRVSSKFMQDEEVNTYWRKQHNRTRNGQVETVRGHFVSRFEWDGSRTRLFFARQIVEMGIVKARQYLNPNANCPECGASVYFFRHENGGCAWFDGVGQPWPIHPCMEKAETRCFPNTVEPALKIKKLAKCRNFRMPVQLGDALESSKDKKRRVIENLGEYGFNATSLFASTRKCVCCNEEVVAFANNDGGFCAFQKFGPPWSEHIPYGEDEVFLKKYRNSRHEQSKNRKHRNAISEQLGQLLRKDTNSSFAPLVSENVLVADASLKSKMWNIFILKSVIENKGSTTLELVRTARKKSRKFIQVPISKDMFTDGEIIFVGKRVEMITFFSQRELKPYFFYFSKRKTRTQKRK